MKLIALCICLLVAVEHSNAYATGQSLTRSSGQGQTPSELPYHRSSFSLRWKNSHAGVIAKSGSAVAFRESDNLASNPSSNVSSLNFNDLTCTKWTGGWCNVFLCNPMRGPVVCHQGYCVCPEGYCSTARGVCEKGNRGKRLGTYAVRFLHAHNSSKPYLGLQHTDAGKILPEQDAVTRLPGKAHQDAQWNVVLDPQGAIRFESAAHPGQVLAMGHGGDGHLSPRLSWFAETEPWLTSFWSRKSADGRLEIWSPAYEVALASSDRYTPNSFLAPAFDGGNAQGVAECHLQADWAHERCEGHESVAFEPALPGEAIFHGQETKIFPISMLTPGQAIAVLICVAWCCMSGVKVRAA
mmetsp:Transcript_30555/g.76859  ORF Transcript_30555/g.76859 Transcript_30555/m.76859 type:complete len:354 (-) Transcript_30555:114-1175(-)